MQLFRLRSQQWIQLDGFNLLGCGGEGRVFSVLGDVSLAAKLYDVPGKNDRTEKLRAMLEHSPVRTDADQHVSIAWPIDLLAGSPDGPVLGYLMPRIQNGRVIDDYYNPPTRLEHCPLFHYEYLLCTARNLAAAMHSVHKRGYVLGDVKQSNILVAPNALVSLVDTDSFQVVHSESGEIYRCMVGTPEYTPPELQGETTPGVLGPEHDRFGLAVLIFQLLMEGSHPFAGIYSGDDDPPPLGERIRMNHFPYLGHERTSPLTEAPMLQQQGELAGVSAPICSPGRKSLPFHVVAPELRSLFLRCFLDGYIDPARRPSAQNWLEALNNARASLLTCGINSQHRYGSHLDSCPWCERMATQLRGNDPFPSIDAIKSRTAPPTPIPSQPTFYAPSPGSVQPTAALASPPTKSGNPTYLGPIGVAGAIIAVLLGSAFSISGPSYPGYAPPPSYSNGVPQSVPEFSDGGLPRSGYTQRSRPTPSALPVQSALSDALLSPDGQRVLLDRIDTTVADTLTGENQHQIPFPVSEDINGRRLAFSRDGSLIGVGGSDGTVTVWNEKKSMRAFQIYVQASVHSLEFAPDGRSLAVGLNGQGAINVLSTKDGALIQFYAMETGETPYLMRFTPDGKRLLVVTSGSAGVADQSSNVKMYCWDVQKQNPLWVRNDLPYATSLEVSPDSQTIGVGGVELSLLSVQTGATTRHLRENADICAFSPDGSGIAIKDPGGVRIIPLLDSRDPRQHIHGFGLRQSLCFRFMSDGRTGISITKEAVVYRWDLRTGRCILERVL